jgi:hypothetical protein
MASQSNPNEPYDRKDPTRTYIDDRRSPVELDNDLQVDPEMAEGPASNARITLFAIGIAVVLGLVFYELNTTSTQQQASTMPAAPAAQSAPASPPPANTQPGTTTGTAPAKPQAPSPASTGPSRADTNTASPDTARQ